MPGHHESGGRKFDLDVITNYFLLGATSQEVAFFLGLDPEDFEFLVRHDAILRAAVERGTVLADALVAQSLFRRATGYAGREAKVMKVGEEIRVVEFTQYYQPDVTAATTWLARRRPDIWGPKVEGRESDVDRENKAANVARELESKLARLAPKTGATSLAKQPVAGRA
jgi:hypothetical protein